jgi:polar amino acid transport system permease protein
LVLVVLPQAWPLILPPIFGYFVLFIKDTALASQAGVLELTAAGRILNTKGFPAFLVFGTVLLLYFALSYPLARLGAELEARLGASRHPRP